MKGAWYMRSRLMVVLAVIVAISLSCTAFAAEKDAKKGEFDQKAALEELWKAPDSTVVGSVNGVNVTKGELMKTIWLWQAPTTLQDLLNQKMIQQAAAKDKVELNWAEVQSKIDESVKRMGVQDVDQLLNQFKVTWYRFMSGTKISALAEKTVQQQVDVTDAEFAEWLKARHILVRFPQEESDKAKQEEIAKKKADEISEKIKAGGDFAKLADEYSEDPGNARDGQKQGGDLGWFSRGRMVQEFESAAFEMKAGEISEPVKTFYGYHIIKVEKLGKDATPAEKQELRKMILEKKVPMAMGQWFSQLQSGAKVENKLMPPPIQEPTPAMMPHPAPARPAPAPAQPKVAPAQPKPAVKPGAPPAGDKPEMPPPPPPPAP